MATPGGGYKITNGGTATILAGKHDLAAGAFITIPLHKIDRGTAQKIKDGDLTADPTIDAAELEALIGAGGVPNTPYTSFRGAVEGDQNPGAGAAMKESSLVTQCVFENTDTPQAKATGVRVTLALQDGSANIIYGASGFRVRVTAAGSGASQNAAGLTVTPASGHAVEGGESDEIEFKNGRATVIVTATTAGQATLSMTGASRAITVTDTQIITLT